MDSVWSLLYIRRLLLILSEDLMHDKERKFHEERIALFIKRLKNLYYEDASPLTADYCLYEPMVGYEKKHLGEYQKIL